MPRKDDDGFEIGVLDKLLLELPQNKNNFEGLGTPNDYLIHLDSGENAYLLTNHKFLFDGCNYSVSRNGHETDIVLLKGDFNSENKSFNADYFLTVECKNYSGSIKRDHSLDLIGRNVDLGVDDSFIVRKENGNDFNWQRNFTNFGISLLDSEQDFSGVITGSFMNSNSLTKNALDDFMTERKSCVNNSFKNNLINEVNKKAYYRERYGCDHRNTNLIMCSRIGRVLKEQGYDWAACVQDVILDGKGFFEGIGFSAPLVAYHPEKDRLLVGTYHSNDLNLRNVRNLFGRTLAVWDPQVRGVAYYSGTVKPTAFEFVNNHTDTIFYTNINSILLPEFELGLNEETDPLPMNKVSIERFF